MQKRLKMFVHLAAGAVIMLLPPFAQGAAKRVTVGNKNFTEQYIAGQLIKQLLESRGFRVNLKSDLTSMALRAGMESGDIDICAEYTGTAWMVHLKQEFEPGTGHNALYQMVRKADEANHFIWLQPIWNNNTYAFASWPGFARKHHAFILSDLAQVYRQKPREIRTFVNFEFSTRPDGLSALEKFYDFQINKRAVRTGTPGASLLALKAGQTDVAMVFGTDASIAKFGWHVYGDDKSFFPPYDLTPCVRGDLIKKYPDIADILTALVNTFPGAGGPASAKTVLACQKVWQTLNARVDIDRLEPSEVAREYLLQKGLIKR